MTDFDSLSDSHLDIIFKGASYFSKHPTLEEEKALWLELLDENELLCAQFYMDIHRCAKSFGDTMSDRLNAAAADMLYGGIHAGLKRETECNSQSVTMESIQRAIDSLPPPLSVPPCPGQACRRG